MTFRALLAFCFGAACALLLICLSGCGGGDPEPDMRIPSLPCHTPEFCK
jgi:hypothetical protein